MNSEIKNKFLPFDITKVRSAFDLHLDWPLSIYEYTSIAKTVYEEFASLLKNLPIHERQLFLTETSSLNYLINFINFNISEKKCLSSEIEFQYGSLSSVFDRNKFPISFKNFGSLSPENSLKIFAKSVVKNLNYSFKATTQDKSQKDFIFTKTFLYAVKNPLQFDYIKSNTKKAKYIDYNVNRIIEQGISVPPQENFLREQITLFLNNLVLNAKLCDDTAFIQKLIESWCFKLSRNALLIKNFQSIFDDKSKLFLGSPAKPLSKMLSFACQNKGGFSISFSHGNELGEHVELDFTRPISEFQCYNEFIFSSDRIAKRYASLTNQTEMPLPNIVKFTSSNAKTYLNLINKSKKIYAQNKNRSVKKIMLLGYPMGPYRIWAYTNSFFYEALKIETALCRQLREAGYEIVYKAHPDRIGYIEKIIGPLVNEVIIEKFEDVMDKADAFLFHYTHTSTFGAALCSKKPITLYSSELNNFRKRDLSLLKKRVSIVNSKLNGSFDLLLKSFEEPKRSFSLDVVLDLIE